MKFDDLEKQILSACFNQIIMILKKTTKILVGTYISFVMLKLKIYQLIKAINSLIKFKLKGNDILFSHVNRFLQNIELTFIKMFVM